MNVMMADTAKRVKHLLRSLANWLAPGGSRRQLFRVRLTRRIRSWMLPRRAADAPPLPDFSEPSRIAAYLELFELQTPTDVDGRADSVLHWLDFHSEALLRFPLATTPAQLDSFTSWLMKHHTRFELRVADIIAFVRAFQDDPSLGIAALYHRSPEWQWAVPNGLAPAQWNELKAWLAVRFNITEPWLRILTPDSTTDGGELRATRGVNLLAHFCYPCGLEVAARATRAALIAAGWDVSCRDVPNNARTDRPERSPWLGLHPHPITIVQLAPERLGSNAYEVAGLDRRSNVYRIGYWYWELADAPKAWARQSDWLHEIWAPTRFVAESLRRVMTIPVHEMLPAVELPGPVDMPRSRFGLPDNRFLFLFAFDMSSSQERKNPEAVVAAFRKAFSPAEPVTLAIKITRGEEDAAGLAELHAGAEPGRIVILNNVMSRPDVVGLLSCCDAYVSLHRSEGLGLTLIEAMSLGKPTIATRYSGNLDYMTDANSRLVDFEMTTLKRAVSTYPRGARWAEPSIDAAASAMRWVVDHPAEASAMAERGRDSVLKLFSLEAAAGRMTARLERYRVERA